MLAAASAWDGLAAELQATANSYQSVLAHLADETWRGPASASMTAAAAPYVTWMTITAGHAEQTATQAKAAVSAYETTFATIVPPSAIAANRAQLAVLIATNFLGQNTAAIAATEAVYAAMWAQDAGAMYSYAGSAAAASTLPSFTTPPKTTNSNAAAGQAAAVTQVTGHAAGSQVRNVASTLSAVTQAMQGLTQPSVAGLGHTTFTGAATGSGKSAAMAAGLLQGLAPVGTNAGAQGLALDTLGLGMDTVGLAGMEAPGLGTEFAGLGIEFGGLGIELAPQAGLGALGGLEALGSLGSLGGLAGLSSSTSLVSTASATLGQAASIGGALSVPQSWATAAPLASLSPTFQPVAIALPVGGTTAVGQMLTGAAGNTFSDMAMAGAAGRAFGGATGVGRRIHTEIVTRQSAKPVHDEPTREPATATVAELRELAELLRDLANLRDSGTLTEEEFAEQKQRLLGH